MHKLIFLLLAVAHVGYSVAAAELDGIGNKELPAGAVLLCREHVVGDASGKPMHIDWQAFGLDEEPDKIKQFYHARFGQPPALEVDRGYTWTFKGERNTLHYAVKHPSAAGPWSRCPIQAANFKAIVLISKATWTTVR